MFISKTNFLSSNNHPHAHAFMEYYQIKFLFVYLFYSGSLDGVLCESCLQLQVHISNNHILYYTAWSTDCYVITYSLPFLNYTSTYLCIMYAVPTICEHKQYLILLLITYKIFTLYNNNHTLRSFSSSLTLISVTQRQRLYS